MIDIEERARLREYYHQLKAVDKPLILASGLYSVPKGRPRFSGNHAYTPMPTRLFETQIRELALSKGWRPYGCPVTIRISITIEVPKSYDKVQQLMADLGMTTPPRGDLDNRVKAITDALNGVAYYDDVQITEKYAKKMFGAANLISVEIARAGLSDTEMDRFKKLKGMKKVGHAVPNSGSSNSVG